MAADRWRRWLTRYLDHWLAAPILRCSYSATPRQPGPAHRGRRAPIHRRRRVRRRHLSLGSALNSVVTLVPCHYFVEPVAAAPCTLWHRRRSPAICWAALLYAILARYYASVSAALVSSASSSSNSKPTSLHSSGCARIPNRSRCLRERAEEAPRSQFTRIVAIGVCHDAHQTSDISDRGWASIDVFPSLWRARLIFRRRATRA